jgi:hypothetical protein
MTSRKVSKTQLSAITELKNTGGAVIVSDWTTGSGRFTKPRAIPPHCKRIERRAAWLPAWPQRIKRVFRQHPRCQAVIAITNMRAVNALLKQS